jgi:hypothetical protein
MSEITPNTPLVMLTVAQFEELLNKNTKAKQEIAVHSPKRYVYGLKGICELFNCAHSTAQRLKDEVIMEAVSQNGRKIVVDAELAIKLFKERKPTADNKENL